MAFSLKGYVLEKPRLGTSNSAFTASPDNTIVNGAAFGTAYPWGSEPNPRTEYLVYVETDGNLPDARFAWTKNEGKEKLAFQRFDYEGMEQRFKFLPGGPLDQLPTPLNANANTTRLKAPKPSIDDLSLFPMRVSVGSSGSGTTMTIQLVDLDTSFGSPPPGTVELSLETGNLNWNTADLSTYAGQIVRVQRQSFFTFKDSKGRIGVVGSTLILNPLPATGQFPLIRFGYGRDLTSIERPNEGALSANPAAGTVEWALDTGLLKFNSSDAATNAGKSVYYGGVAFARDVGLTTQTLGTMPGGYTGLNMSNMPSVGGDLIIRAGAYQFSGYVYVDAFSDPIGKRGIVQIKQTGSNAEFRFSLADVLLLTGQTVTVTVADLVVERGVALRLFRNPVNLDAANSELKDVSAVYTVTNALLASPIIGAPQVFLPSVPIDDGVAPLSVRVEQGSGSFVGQLARLDVGSPSPGFGYVLDLDQRILSYAQRRQNQIIPIVQPSGALYLGNPLVQPSAYTFELETGVGTGVFTTLVPDQQVLLDATGGVINFVETDGELILSGVGASISGTTLTDAAANFTGVQSGDILIVPGGSAKGVYVITNVPNTTSLTLDASGGTGTPVSYTIHHGREILLDRFFEEVILADPKTEVERVRKLGAITNSPRHTIPPDQVDRSRFRFGLSTFSGSVTVVPNDGAFTAPASLSSLAVEISADTGNVNFSQDDVNAGEDVFHAYKLKQQIDYQISAPLGFIDFNQRSLEFDEAYVTYKPEATGVLVTEQVTWQVRKEVTASHPSPTNILSFNPTNRRVASLPPAAVFRGGRPQVTGEQCLVNPGPPSTIQFLPDDILTDALPHGAVIGPDERVYVDYFVYEAMPGDKTTTVLSPPMVMVQLVISAADENGQPNSQFTLNGDWTNVFKPNHLFRIEQEEVYIVGAVVYDTPSQATTVTLATPQAFANDFQAPKVYQSSGPTPFVSSPGQPSYFAPEPAAYDPVPKGSNRFTVEGDRTNTYKSGTVAAFTDGTTSFLELYLVTGAAYKADTNRTEVTLATNSLRQYVSANGHLLRHSVRPIVESASASVRTQRPPVTTRPSTSPITVYRKVAGQKGTVLTAPTDYTIDDSGEVKFKTSLLRDEEFGILYTGNIIVNSGRNVRATYSHLIVPTAENGILNQVLKMDYQLYSPDTWFYRVETFTNYRAELSQQYEQAAKSGTPSGGPNTSNMPQPKLYEQGRPSAFFDEGRYANEDVVARASLKWYNDTINYLEDVLQNVDGRVVGHRSGRFKFDGNLNPGNVNPGSATNQIDDIVKISDAPFSISFSFPNFSVGALGTYQKFYLPSSFSRFYPTQKFIYGVSANATETGQTVLDLKAKNVTAVVDLSTRPAFAIVTRDAPAGATTVTVDNAQGNAGQVRPPFLNGMKCLIQKRDGTFVANVLAPVTVSSVVSATTLAVSPLPAAVPAGSTIYRSPIDDSNASGGAQPIVSQMVHYNPPSYSIDPEKGLLLYTKATPPLDGSSSPTPVPNELVIKQIPAGQPLQCFAQFSNSLTEPLRIPALDGLAVDDAGSLTFPILTPSFEAEVIPSTVLPPSGGGYAYNEYEIVKTGGSLRAATQAPFVGTGTMNVGGTIVTSSTAFGSPVPKQYDLLRITSGVNAASAYRRIVSVVGTAITVDTPFTFDGGGFQFTVTVSTSLVTGTAFTTTVNGALLTDTSANFITAGVQAGHTVVFTSGSIVGDRYQVLAVTSATTLLLHTSTGLPSTSIGYHIDNPLNTYGGPGSLFDILTTSVQGQIDVLSTNVPPKPLNEAAALEASLEQAFENVVSPSTGSASGTTFTDPGATFQSSDVLNSHFLYIRNGVAAGVYKVMSVNSETQLTVSPSFPSADPSAGYRVVSSFEVTYNSLSDLFVQLTAIESYVAGIPPFLAKLSQAQVIKPGPVTDTVALANTLTTADLDTREPVVQSRVNTVSDPNGIVTKVSNVLSGADKLYDKRYVWIDARINFEKGILTRLSQAVDQRKKTQADVVKNLTKLLAVS
jgi:hypothetical protein